MSERLSTIQQFLSSHYQDADFHLEAISGDASFRRYFRVQRANTSAILMDAPPALEDGQRFIAVTAALAQAKVRVPVILAQDTAVGLILLEDLGDQLLYQLLTGSDAATYYREALALLPAIRSVQQTHAGALPCFDRAFLLREMQLFIDWFVTVHLGVELDSAQLHILKDLFSLLADAALEQPQMGMHRDFHSRNLMLLPNLELAVIDYQDMVIGPVSYDAVSLLKDCYLNCEDALFQRLRNEFYLSLKNEGILDVHWSAERFALSFDLMGLQRHIKVCGIFSRLYHRDGKKGYLNDLPRVLGYIESALPKTPAFQPFADLLHHTLIPQFQRVSALAGEQR